MYDHKNIEASYISQCSDAARRNLRLGRHIYERCNSSSDKKLVMLDLHHIFNAAVVLLLHQMTIANVVNTDTLGIRAARQIFEHEARTECASPGPAGVQGSGYASDCLGVLNDLAALVARIRPLRFRGSEHVNTGVVDWQVLTDEGMCEENIGAVTDEQLAANLNLTNPYGAGFGGEEVMMQHTNGKEFERWVSEAEWGLGREAGGYTGI